MNNNSIYIEPLDNNSGYKVEWHLPFNNHVNKRVYRYTKLQDVIQSIKNDVDYCDEPIIINRGKQA